MPTLVRLGARADAATARRWCTRVPGRAGWELRLVVQGGLRILEKIERLDYATLLHARPRLRRRDAPLLLWRALRDARRRRRRWREAAA